MCTKRSFIFLLLGTLSLSGCAARRYQSAPIVPTESLSRLESRNLSDPGLQVFVEDNVGHPVAPWPPKTWDLGTLSLAALYFNPTLEAARARVEEGQAAVVTAGARPNPSLSIAPGIPSPYLFNLDLAVPIETAGKRGHRIESARSLEQAARFDLADSFWRVRSGVRIALLNYLLDARSLDLLRAEEHVRRDQVNTLEQRFSVGEIPRPEVDLARIELSKTHLVINTAEGQIAEAKAALAASIGIPVAGLQGLDFSWSDLDSPPSAESISPRQIQRDAILNRLDVRRSLAQYAASEAEAIARRGVLARITLSFSFVNAPFSGAINAKFGRSQKLCESRQKFVKIHRSFWQVPLGSSTILVQSVGLNCPKQFLIEMFRLGELARLKKRKSMLAFQ